MNIFYLKVTILDKQYCCEIVKFLIVLKTKREPISFVQELNEVNNEANTITFSFEGRSKTVFIFCYYPGGKAQQK